MVCIIFRMSENSQMSRLCRVLFVGCTVNFLAIGTTFASGVLFDRLMEYYGAGEVVTSWIHGIQVFMFFSSGTAY